MVDHRIEIIKHEFTLKVLDGKTPCRSFPIAIGERDDGKNRFYEEDFRTPEGQFNVSHIVDGKKDPKLISRSNQVYYPFYLAHKQGNPFEDAGAGVYGSAIIALTYPRLEDLTAYRNLVDSGEVLRDWQWFMEEKWRAIFEFMAQQKKLPFEKTTLSSEQHTSSRSFIEGKTFEELFYSTPPQPRLQMAIHGTNDPNCIGHKISGGCVRMHNKDIEELIKKYLKYWTEVSILP
ncbi:MAG: L,D-transpeptidase [Candidatus Pacearchaeota archaeon]|jgi:hypothetical protein